MGEIVGLQQVRRLLLSLNKEEVGTLKRFLTLRRKKTKTLQIVELVLNSKQISDTRIRETVTPGNSASTFSALLSELRNKIFEVIALDMNIARKPSHGSYHQAKYWARKRMITAEVLLGRGCADDAIQLYDEIIEKCREFEIYATLIEALTIKRNLVAIFQGEVSLSEMQQQIDHYSDGKAAYEKAWFYHDYIGSIHNFTSNTSEAFRSIVNVVDELEDEYLKSSSKSCLYYFTFVKLYVLEKQGNFEEGLSILRSLRPVVVNAPPLSLPIRLAKVDLSIANVLLMLKRPLEAIPFAKSASSLYKDKFNHGLAKEQLFLAYFHVGEALKAHNAIKSLVANTESNKAFYKARRYYYHACVHMISGRCKVAHEKLQFTKALDTDKNGWNIAVRILDIMNQIEWGGLNHSGDAKSVNLKNHIYKTKKLKPISKRNLAILEILKALIKEGANFSRVAEQMADTLGKLSGEEGGFGWDMTSPELIRFDAWFKSKVEEVEYRYDLVH